MSIHRRLAPALILIAAACVLWAQGGRRGANPAATQQQPAGRGGAPPAAGAAAPAGNLDFYNFDPTAGTAPSFTDAKPFESHQKIAALAYTTYAGFMPLHNATTGQSEAHLFYTAYTKDGVTDAASRPLVVFVAGASGVSAAFQEFGGFGPKRMKSAMDAGWSENPSTLLTHADLVFVNPVGTGFSRPDRPDRAMAFWNTAAETASLGEFIRSYLTQYDRRTSPLYLIGEDAGTGRVASLAQYLADHQMPLHGIALLSVHPSADSTSGDAQYITLLPSLVMTAWHHKKLSPELNGMSSEQIAGQARQFASREYLHALYKGDRMSADERAKVLADLARLTGLSKSFLAANDLRVTLDRFNSELLREQHRGFAPSDSRVTGYLQTPVQGGRGAFAAPPTPPVDFNLAALSGGFLTAYDAYLRRELGFTANPGGIFYLTSGGVSTYTSTGNDDNTLAAAFARNPNLRLFVSVNYFDLSAPFYAAEFTLAHLNVSPEVRARNITVTHLDAGGMPYLDSKALDKLHTGLASFVSPSNTESK